MKVAIFDFDNTLVETPYEESIDYMDTSKWFPEMKAVVATGSLNRCDTDKKQKGRAISYMSDGGNLDFNRPKVHIPTPSKLRSIDAKYFERNSKYGKVYKG